MTRPTLRMGTYLLSAYLSPIILIIDVRLNLTFRGSLMPAMILLLLRFYALYIHFLSIFTVEKIFQFCWTGDPHLCGLHIRNKWTRYPRIVVPESRFCGPVDRKAQIIPTFCWI